MAAAATPSKGVQKQCWYPSCETGESATKRCGKCTKAMYCGAACQQAHWGNHKVTCVAPASKAPPKPPSAAGAAGTAGATAAVASAVLPPVPNDSKSKAADKTGFDLFLQMNMESDTKMALSEARKYAALGKMREAVDFVSLMVPSDQEVFLKEMDSNAAWKTLEVAVILATKSKRMKEAMAIMEGLPNERGAFMAAIGVTKNAFLGNYKHVTVVSG